MLSTEYRESIERRFHAFCKAVLHNEACNYYRERKRRIQREISFEYLQERHKAYIGRLSGGNADMKERLNAKLLMAVLKFRLEYQPSLLLGGQEGANG